MQSFVRILFVKMDIGKRIKEIVERKGMKMEHVYNSIEMTNAGFYRMLKNNSFKVSTLIKIADLLEVPIEAFFSDEADELRDKLVGIIQATKDIEWGIRLWSLCGHSAIEKLEKILQQDPRNGKEIQEIIELIKKTEVNSNKWLYRHFTDEQMKAKDALENDWTNIVKKHIDANYATEEELTQALQTDMWEIVEKYILVFDRKK